jgi:hypothetical protein
MSDVNDVHQFLFVVYAVDYPIVADAKTPEIFRADQLPHTCRARVRGQFLDAVEYACLE